MKYAAAYEGFILFHIEHSEIFHNPSGLFHIAQQYFTQYGINRRFYYNADHRSARRRAIPAASTRKNDRLKPVVFSMK